LILDPVCGKEVRPRRAAAVAFYRGRFYYFCSKEHKEIFEGDPAMWAPRSHAMKVQVGVMGAASGHLSREVRQKAFDLGAAIARHEMVLITGAAPGLPYESARGAQAGRGLSIGISPALSLDEHIYQYQSPVDVFDIMIYTGSGLMGREIDNIRSSDIVVIIGGHSGTLGEFAIAYDEGKLIGVVEGSGGITEIIPDLVRAMAKSTGSALLYDPDPAVLVDRLIDAYVGAHFRRPSVFEQNTIDQKGWIPG